MNTILLTLLLLPTTALAQEQRTGDMMEVEPVMEEVMVEPMEDILEEVIEEVTVPTDTPFPLPEVVERPVFYRNGEEVTPGRYQEEEEMPMAEGEQAELPEPVLDPIQMQIEQELENLQEEAAEEAEESEELEEEEQVQLNLEDEASATGGMGMMSILTSPFLAGGILGVIIIFGGIIWLLGRRRRNKSYTPPPAEPMGTPSGESAMDESEGLMEKINEMK